MAKDYGELSKVIDRMIVDYKTNEALKLMDGITLSKVPDSMRASFASLARRLGRPKMALKILHPNVINLNKAKVGDAIEYATNLRRLGLIQQCRRVLERLPRSEAKDLHLAFCSIHQWDYQRAQGELEQYLGQTLDPKSRLIAQVNLAAALIFTGDLERAEKLLTEIRVQSERAYPHLYINSLELTGQILILQNRWAEADRVLDQALELIGSQEGLTTNQIEKWKWILKILKEETRLDSEEIARFRSKLRSTGDWESLRHFDWQLGKATGSLHQVQSVYFCSPYAKFKAMIQEPMPKFMTRIDPRFQGEPIYINTLTGEGMDLPFGLAEHRLILLMLSDRYQPWTIQRIFDFMSPDENYDPFMSPKKIYGLIDRASKNLSNQPGLELKSSKVGYRLRPQGPGHCHVFQQMIFSDSKAVLFYALQLAFAGRPFDLEDVRKLIPSLSPSKAYRSVQELADEGLVRPQGVGKRRGFVLS